MINSFQDTYRVCFELQSDNTCRYVRDIKAATAGDARILVSCDLHRQFPQDTITIHYAYKL